MCIRDSWYRLTWVVQDYPGQPVYQKGKTNPGFTEAKDSEWRWHHAAGLYANDRHLAPDNPVTSLPALGPWAPPAERGPSPETIYRVSLTVDLCEGNKIISLKKFISPQPVGGPSKRQIRYYLSAH